MSEFILSEHRRKYAHVHACYWQTVIACLEGLFVIEYTIFLLLLQITLTHPLPDPTIPTKENRSVVCLVTTYFSFRVVCCHSHSQVQCTSSTYPHTCAHTHTSCTVLLVFNSDYFRPFAVTISSIMPSVF